LDQDNDNKLIQSDVTQLFKDSGIEIFMPRIWGLADRTKDNKLDIDEFCLLMSLINAKNQGRPLPIALPQSLLLSVYGHIPSVRRSLPQPGGSASGVIPITKAPNKYVSNRGITKSLSTIIQPSQLESLGINKKGGSKELENIKPTRSSPLPEIPKLSASMNIPLPSNEPQKKSNDWREAFAPDGRVYYFNKKTKERTWVKPQDYSDTIESTETQDTSLFWKEAAMPDGKKYYYNTVTRETSWTPLQQIQPPQPPPQLVAPQLARIPQNNFSLTPEEVELMRQEQELYEEEQRILMEEEEFRMQEEEQKRYELEKLNVEEEERNMLLEEERAMREEKRNMLVQYIQDLPQAPQHPEEDEFF